MKLLEEKILKDARVLPGGVLKLDSFLNQQIDVKLADEMAKEWHQLFANEGITKIVTIEASGIGIACIAALRFGVPVVYAKKSRNLISSEDNLTARVTSYTHGNTYNVCIAKSLISADDRILIIDDLLANGSALSALVEVCKSGAATVVGAGIAIEKVYQGGGAGLRRRGLRIESLAKIASVNDNGTVTFTASEE